VGTDPEARPTTHEKDLARMPRALAPLCERPQWAVWRWTQMENGRWQKPPFVATQPRRHASTKDPSTWSEYGTALSTVQAGKADGLSYILTEHDPFAAIDLDHCRHVGTHSIDVWAQNFLDAGRYSYSEVTPSGSGCRIWGLANGNAVHKKFSLEIDGKLVAVELFRRTNKALTITGYRLDTVRELANIDRVIDWGLVWGERRKAAAVETVAPVEGNGFNGSGSQYSIDQIEQIVRDGPPPGGNRSDVFHSIVGHYIGCGWSAEQILEHLQQFPDGIGGRYLREDRLHKEIVRSASKYAVRTLPLLDGNGGWVNGWDAKAPQPEIFGQGWPSPESVPNLVQEECALDSDLDDDDDLDDQPPQNPQSPPLYAHAPQPEIPKQEQLEPLHRKEAPELEDNDPDEGDLDEDSLRDPKLPPLYTYGDVDPRPPESWLVKHLIPACGHGLLSGQWGTGKTFVVFDLAAALMTGQPFLGHAIKRQCGVLVIAAEGADQVRLRLEAVVRAKCGSMIRAPLCWYETAPLLLHKGSTETLIAMAQQANDVLRQEFGLPLGLIAIDTIAACAGYARAGDENDPAAGQAVMNVLKTQARAMNCFVLGIDHFGKARKPAPAGPPVRKLPAISY
jgi:AAA domain